MTRLLSRRSALQAVAIGSLAAIAGCVSSNRGRSDLTATTSVAELSTPGWFDCDEVESPPNPAGTDDISPKSYPDFPERLARSNVAEFVTAYERAYKWNEILVRERNLTYVDITHVDVSDTERTDEGFVVRVVVEFGWGESSGSEGETATSIHADGGSKVSYFVGERVLKRVASDDWEFVDPRTADGTVLRCGSETTTE